MKVVNSICIVAITVGLGCRQEPKKSEVTPPRAPTSFKDSYFSEIVPVADGGAYGKSYDSGIWYLRGPEAIKVEFTGLPTSLAEQERIDLISSFNVVPDAQGGAYGSVDEGLWYLREGRADRVTNVQALSSKPISGFISDAFPAFALERQNRLRAERQLDELKVRLGE